MPPYTSIYNDRLGEHLAVPLLPYSKKRPIVKETIVLEGCKSIHLRFATQTWSTTFCLKTFPGCWICEIFVWVSKAEADLKRKTEDARIFKSKQLTVFVPQPVKLLKLDVYSPSRGPGDRTFKSKNPALEFHHLDDQSRIFWTKKTPQKGSKLQEFHPFPPIFP